MAKTREEDIILARDFEANMARLKNWYTSTQALDTPSGRMITAELFGKIDNIRSRIDRHRVTIVTKTRYSFQAMVAKASKCGGKFRRPDWNEGEHLHVPESGLLLYKGPKSNGVEAYSPTVFEIQAKDWLEVE